jgi:hypothetical protein
LEVAIEPCRNSGKHRIKHRAHLSGTRLNVLHWADRVDGLFPTVAIQRKYRLPCIEDTHEEAHRFSRVPVRNRGGQSGSSVRHGRH